jgi:UDP-N-acetylmuramoyl-tripeptide--D-alanyl-D-alanine ligase
MATLHDLHEAIHGVLKPVTGSEWDPCATTLGPVVTDSRHVAPGDVYWGLVGPHHDGAEFTDEAFGRGAIGAVVGSPIQAPDDRWAITVEDPQKALEQWAAWNRRQCQGTVIAVTGSVGKTTSRQMIHTVLKSRLVGTASPRNYNNHVGLPLSMLQIEPTHDYAVLELGASHPGEIASLAALCAPKIGIITRVGNAHLATFGSERAIAEAKSELLAALPSDGHAILGDDPWLRRMASRCQAPITWVGHTPECDLVADDIRCGHGQLCFRVEDCEFTVPVWGRHHLTSALAAVAVGRVLGFELPAIAAALKNFESVPMRCQVMELREATIINDAYNASPMSMQAALELLHDFDAEGRRIVVCGDMAELGDEAVMFHRRLGNQVVTIADADLLIACGEYARDVVAGARGAGMSPMHSIPCRTPEDALPYLGQAINPGDVVLVKGSRVVGMENLIEAMRQYPKRRTA